MIEAHRRLVVVLPLDPLEAGDRFEVAAWPLHVTVVPPFDSSAPLDAVAERLSRVAAQHRPFAVCMGPDAMFGRREDILVTLVVPDPRLSSLHDELGNALTPLMRRPSHPHRSFAPHVTAKRHARAHEGEVYTLSQVALVDMAPRAHPGGRVVLAVASLVEPGSADHSTT